MSVPLSEPTDPWFGAHFSFAAPMVCEWLAPVLAPGAVVLDFGCGDGITTLSVALQNPDVRVVGLDIHAGFDRLAERAGDQLGLEQLPDNLSFFVIESGAQPAQSGSIDGFFSWSTFEHIGRDEMSGIATGLQDALKPGGLGFIQIEPLYYAPFGSHMGHFLDEPWAHLLLDRDEFVHRIRTETDEVGPLGRDERYRRRGPEAHREFMIGEFDSLNRLTADELVKVWGKAGLRVNREHRIEVDLSPPRELLDRYRREDLMTNEVRMLIERPKPTLFSRLWRR